MADSQVSQPNREWRPPRTPGLRGAKVIYYAEAVGIGIGLLADIALWIYGIRNDSIALLFIGHTGLFAWVALWRIPILVRLCRRCRFVLLRRTLRNEHGTAVLFLRPFKDRRLQLFQVAVRRKRYDTELGVRPYYEDGTEDVSCIQPLAAALRLLDCVPVAFSIDTDPSLDRLDVFPLRDDGYDRIETLFGLVRALILIPGFPVSGAIDPLRTATHEPIAPEPEILREMRLLREQRVLSRVVVYMPPRSRGVKKPANDIALQWQRLRKGLAYAYGYALPPYKAAGCVYTPNEDYSIRKSVVLGRSDAHGIALALSALLDEPSGPSIPASELLEHGF